MGEYLGKQATPYDYGYMVELFPDTDGGLSTAVQKQYAMGRFSHENAVIMPDRKTVYYGDDDADAIFFKFVADAPGDLSAGSLFAAKVNQMEDESFSLEWIELGKGNNEVIAQTIGAIALPNREID